MEPNPYAFNINTQYPARGGFPRNLTAKNLQELSIQVVIPEKTSGRGDFPVRLQDVFSKYRMPHISSDKYVNLWHTHPMGFFQNQVNFAVWCATTGCGVSWRDHLNIDRALARGVFRFHVYYQVRRILAELKAPLPQDQAWRPLQNPFDQRAYERICREFGVNPHTVWQQKDSKSGGLGTVYMYHGGSYQPRGSYNKSQMRFQSDGSLPGASPLWAKEHIDYISQGQEADEAWSTFILDNSKGFTQPGVERLNDSIRTYVWAVLSAQAQTRAGIIGVGTSFDAQKQFLANVEDAISSPVDLPAAIDRYQGVLQYAGSEVNFSFGIGLYMAPSDMLLRVGKKAGYNNLIVIATGSQTLGLNRDLNVSVAPPDAANDTGEKGLVDDPPAIGGPAANQPAAAISPATNQPATNQPISPATNHEDEKTALIVGGIAVGLLFLWQQPFSGSHQ